MKHSVKITLLLLAMFFIAQLIGLAVLHNYAPVKQTVVVNGTEVNQTVYNLPYGMTPPADAKPQNTIYSIIFAIIFGVLLMLILMKVRAELFLRLWFLVVITLAISLALNSFIMKLPIQNAMWIALGIGAVLAIMKVFYRNIYVHNLTELLIYPGISAIFVPLLNIWTVIILLILISIYDIYAVWHAGFMQKMAKYQINKVKVFAGFFIPYVGAKEKKMIMNAKKSGKKNKGVKISVAILGGGDVVFPIITSGIILYTFGFIPALIVSICATIALGFLFYYGRKGKFYPAMPFISAGLFIGIGIVYLMQLI